MMKKVLADFADDADFSGRNILKVFFHAMSLSVSQSARRFLTIFLLFRRNLNLKFSVIICKHSAENRRFDEVNDKVDVNFYADFSVKE